VYAIAPAVARPFTANLPGFRSLPGRDNLTYVLSPWKHDETGARELGESVLGALPANSVLFADYSIWAVVRYLQVVEGARPDVVLVELPPAGSGKQVAEILSHRPASSALFLADVNRYYEMSDIQLHFDVIAWPPIHRLVPR